MGLTVFPAPEADLALMEPLVYGMDAPLPDKSAETPRTTRIIESVEQLRDIAGAWNDLWARSEMKSPTDLAECVALYCEYFEDADSFRVVTVEEDGQLVAALPMMKKRLKRVFSSLESMQSIWAPGGEWMIDPECDMTAVSDLVITTVMQAFPRAPIIFRAIESDNAPWQILLDAAERAGYSCDVKKQFDVSWIQTADTWESYQKTLKKNHRSQMRKYNRRLAELGEVKFEILADLHPDDVPALVREGFEVEHRSWKGRNGTSVLESPGVLEYYTQLACTLANRGQLVLAFVRCDSKPIGFEFGFDGKGVYHSFKVGFDPEYSDFAPGQLVMEHILEMMHNNPNWDAMDCMGPVSMAVGKWRGTLRQVNRVMLIPRRGHLLQWALTCRRWLKGSR